MTISEELLYETLWLAHIRQMRHQEHDYNVLCLKTYVGTIVTKPQWERDRGRCRYCGDIGQSIDHVLPRSRGGERTMANGVVACVPCNSFKGDRTPEEAGMPMLEPGTAHTPEVAAAFRHRIMSTPKKEQIKDRLTQTISISECLVQANRDIERKRRRKLNKERRETKLWNASIHNYGGGQ